MKRSALFGMAALLSASWACGGSGSHATAGATAAAFPTAPSAVLRTYSGTVRAVDGGPLEGVRVTGTDHNAPVVFSDASGSYELARVTGNLIFTKDGYEPNGIRAPSTPDQVVTVNAKLQPRLVLTADTPVSSVVSSDDLTYSSDLVNSFDVNNPDDYYYCSACKEIAISSLASRDGRLRLSWTGSVPLEMWVGEYWTGVKEHQSVQAAQHQLTINMSGRKLDTILVGIGSNNAIAQPIAFRLSVESAE